MKTKTYLLLIALAAGGCSQQETDQKPSVDKAQPKASLIDVSADNFDPTEIQAGGETTEARAANVEVLSRVAPNLSSMQKGIFQAGDNEFESVRTPAYRGPLFNANSCQGCHLKDGRGNPPPAGPEHYMTSMFLRVSNGPDPVNGVLVDPVYGAQLQTYGVDVLGGSPTGLPGGVAKHRQAIAQGKAIGEVHAYIEFEEIKGEYPDGSSYALRKPVYKVKDAAYGDFGDQVFFSPRVAPQMIGLGLLEAIPEKNILAKADENDADGDGISGRPNMVWSVINNQIELGRFGLKASTPTVLQQSAGAYRGDMGLTNSLAINEPCTEKQKSCLDKAAKEATVGEKLDIPDVVLAQVEFYSRTLAVPARQSFTPSDNDPVWRGRKAFFDANCVACHSPRHTTGIAKGSVLGDVKGFTNLHKPAADIAGLSQQTIWPYTDLLLHDMGGSCAAVSREQSDGSACKDKTENSCLWVLRCDGLADGRDDFLATGTEWRTPPLWGIGLAQQVNPNAGFLHDGRARTLEEAVLWHGGEAETSKNTFMNMPQETREDLIQFLQSM